MLLNYDALTPPNRVIERQKWVLSPSSVPTLNPEFSLVQRGVFEIFGSNINPGITTVSLSEPLGRFLPNPKLKLREQLTEVCRYRHLSHRTENACWHWMKGFILFHRGKVPVSRGQVSGGAARGDARPTGGRTIDLAAGEGQSSPVMQSSFLPCGCVSFRAAVVGGARLLARRLARTLAPPIHFARRRSAPAWLLAACLGGFHSAAAAEGNQPPQRKYTNVQRLELARLKAAHEDVLKLRAQRVKLPPLPGLNDYRCILHAHAEDSDHTGGTLPEMLTDAKKAGISAILLTDHFRPPRDFIDGRWRGLKDGVLFIPGSEIRGCLLYPEKSVYDRMKDPFPDLLKAVTAGDGMMFLSHVEERTDHAMDGLTGLEIYNRHWDAKKDMASLIAVAMKLTDPKQLAELEETVRLYPDELLAFQCDYPQVYVDKWDKETRAFRLTGVAANDCHHNQVMVLKMVDENTVLLGTIVDKDDEMRKITAEARPGIQALTQGRKPGDIIARVDLDPYYRSFWNSSTHVLAPKLDERAIRLALKAGHAFVAHDWMCDATGFRFEALNADGELAGIMGDEVKLADGLKLSGQFPIACQTRLLRDGALIAETAGKERAEFAVKAAGVYRLEAWLTVDGEARPWIFGNPIYVR